MERKNIEISNSINWKYIVCDCRMEMCAIVAIGKFHLLKDMQGSSILWSEF
jgi:hypothetical protein